MKPLLIIPAILAIASSAMAAHVNPDITRFTPTNTAFTINATIVAQSPTSGAPSSMGVLHRVHWKSGRACSPCL